MQIQVQKLHLDFTIKLRSYIAFKILHSEVYIIIVIILLNTE